ncbi:MAG: FAD-dependent oxidoreductase [Deltaproteobacteria bacterium]|nr:MAG: FAD-dependent oxidoreductase [Deltaproteobacteria bacterium]
MGSPRKHLVLVGGGHAHMTVMKKLDTFVKRGHQVSVIGPSPHHYYSGMGPGVLSGIYRSQEVRFNIKKMVEDRGGSFVPGTVVRIEPRNRTLLLTSGDEVQYDAISFNVGSHVPVEAPAAEKNVLTVKPIENLLKARQMILDCAKRGEPKVVVVGGGPSGLEISGNVWRLVHDHGAAAQIALLAGHRLLAGFPEKARHLALRSLAARGIEVVEGVHASRFDRGCVLLEDGREYLYDLALLAWGIRPSELFRQSGLPIGEDGGLLVNEHLQSVSYPEVFGGGDCISFESHPLDKVGVHAVRQNPILYHNLLAILEGEKLQRFSPNDTYLLLFNLGDGRAIYWRKDRVWAGRIAFIFKNYLDKKFMRTFQVSGELEEDGSVF